MSKQKTISSTPVVQLASSSRVTPEKARQILAQNGLQVNSQQAAAVVEFLYKLASFYNPGKKTSSNEMESRT